MHRCQEASILIFVLKRFNEAFVCIFRALIEDYYTGEIYNGTGLSGVQFCL